MVTVVAKTAKGRIRNSTKWPHTELTRTQVLDAFGGRPLDIALGAGTSPPTLLAIRQELMTKLRSSGGRPSPADADKKPRIPMSSEDWRVLESLAQAAANGPVSISPRTVSPAQVGYVLMHWAISMTRNDPALCAHVLAAAAQDQTRNLP